MPTGTLDSTFAALADPMRRAILARLSSGGATVTELAGPFGMTLLAVSGHPRVLERDGLIPRDHVARSRPCRLEAAPLREAAGWVVQYRCFWEGSLDRLEDYPQKLRKEDAGGQRR